MATRDGIALTKEVISSTGQPRDATAWAVYVYGRLHGVYMRSCEARCERADLRKLDHLRGHGFAGAVVVARVDVKPMAKRGND